MRPRTPRRPWTVLEMLLIFGICGNANAVTITWTGAVNSSWHTAGNWDLNRVPGAGDDVVISVAANPTITYTTGSTSINSLVIDEIVTFSGGTLIVATTADVNNTVTINGGTLSGGTWDVIGGSLIAGSNLANLLTGVTVSGDIVVGNSGRLKIEGGTSFSNLRITGGGTAPVVGFAPGSVITGNILSEGTQAAQVGMNGSSGTLTVASSGSIRTVTGGVGLSVGVSTYGGNMTLINQGTIGSDVNTRTITINAATGFTNEGLARATNGGTLLVTSPTWTNSSTGTLNPDGGTVTLQNAWSNAGAINVNNGALNLDGTFTTAGLGLANFTRTGGTVNIVGLLNNASTTLTLNSVTGSWTINGGTISGGTVQLNDSQTLITSSNLANLLTGVTVNGDIVVGNSGRLKIEGGTTFTNMRITGGGTAPVVGFAPGSVITGNILGENTVGAQIGMNGSSGTLTVGSTGSIRTATGGIGFSVGVSTYGGNMTLINQGTIGSDVSARTLTINAVTGFTNSGTLRATNGGILVINPGASWTSDSAGTINPDGGTVTLQNSWSNTGAITVNNGTLNLDGTFTTAGLGMANFTRTGGTVNIVGALNNASSTLTLNSVTGSWTVNGGTITGGTVQLNDLQTLIASSNVANLLTGVTVNGDIVVGNSGRLKIEGGTTFTNMRITGGGTAPVVGFAPGSVITGNILGENTVGAQIGMNGSSGTLTVGSTGSIRTATGGIGFSVGVSTYGGNMTLINQGTIGSDVSARTLTINAVTGFTNSGTLRATNGGTLTITSPFTNFSGTTLTGGTYQVTNTSTIRFPGANIVTDAAQIVLDGATSAILNHTTSTNGIANLATITSAGALTIQNGRNLSTPGALANAGNVTTGAGSTLTVAGNYTQTAGTTTLDGGTLDPNNLADIQAGVLKGNGTLAGNLTSSAAVQPGLSAGLLTINGNYTQSFSGSLSLELGGLSPGIGGHDRLAVSGAATLAGDLQVSLINGFQPAVGTTFDGVTAGSVTGTFDNDNIPLIFGGSCKGGPEYGATYVRLLTYARSVFDVNPQSQTICEDDPVTFSVSVSGSGPFSYQWRKNSLNISGANGSSYTINSVTTGDAASYDCVVTNFCGNETSQAAMLSVNTNPVFSQQPQTQTVCENGSVTFTVAANATPAPTYQWRKGRVNINGATGTSSTINSITTADAGSYDCIATNLCNATPSNAATLTVNTAPVISQPPQSQAICEGDPVIFTVAASGSPAPMYQWRKDAQNIGGATGTSYTINAVTLADGGSYDCVVTNVCDADISAPATLTIDTDPIFGQQPGPASSCVGGSAQFSVIATSNPSPSYQWRKGGVNLINGGNISGADTATLTINPIGMADAGQYDCVAANLCAAPDSNDVSLTVFASGSGDMNSDGFTNGRDIQGFVNALLQGASPNAAYCAGDMNGNGNVDPTDVPLFVSALLVP